MNSLMQVYRLMLNKIFVDIITITRASALAWGGGGGGLCLYHSGKNLPYRQQYIRLLYYDEHITSHHAFIYIHVKREK